MTKKKYPSPLTKKIDGKIWRRSGATKYGVPKYDAEYNQRYLKKLGYKTRRIKVGRYYVVYGRKGK